jgi:DNA-binding response OmpR family regulator
MKILLIDHDQDVVDLLGYWLESHGYEVARAYDGEQGIARWRESRPELVIMDLDLPARDGLEVCRQIASASSTLILVLTAQTRESFEVRALDAGADDFVRKPFSPRVLLARLRVLTRRAATAPQAGQGSSIAVGPVALDPMRHEASRDGLRVRLTPTESRLLHVLMTHSGQVLPAARLVERVWGYEDGGENGLVKTHIRHLRQKIEPAPNAPRFIVTVPGAGYTFMRPPSAQVPA